MTKHLNDYRLSDDDGNSDTDWVLQRLDGDTQYANFDTMEPTTEFLCRSDGVGLFYPLRNHTVFGPPESCKTWIHLMGIRDVVNGGNQGLFLDFEEAGRGEITKRLLRLGTKPEVMNNAVYVKPNGIPSLDKWRTMLQAEIFSFACIDSASGALAEMERNHNSNSDITTFQKSIVLPIIDWTYAAASVVDHQPHNANREVGGIAKRATLTGASYRVQVVQQLIPGRIGILDLYVTKDRPGQIRKVSGPIRSDGSQHTARITFDATDQENIITSIDPPPVKADHPATTKSKSKSGPKAITEEMKENIVTVLEKAGGCLPSGDKVLRAVGGDRTQNYAALQALVSDGLVVRTEPAGGRKGVQYSLFRPSQPLDISEASVK